MDPSVHLNPSTQDEDAIARANLAAKIQDGRSLAKLSDDQAVLLIFLRHSGCTFCRQALADLASQRRELSDAGVQPVIVFEETNADVESLLKRYRLDDVPLISDPKRELYSAYNLPRGTFKQILSPKVWWKGFRSAILAKHGFGRINGDLFQMSGVFLIHHGKIIAAHPHKDVADRTDYCDLARKA